MANDLKGLHFDDQIHESKIGFVNKTGCFFQEVRQMHCIHYLILLMGNFQYIDMKVYDL